MTLGQPDIGEQALSKAAEIGLSSQLDEVEDLKVDIRTDPGKLIQGELERVEIEGKGLVMQKDLRTEKLVVKTNSIAINPLKAAFGEIELKYPTTASADIVLTEQNIERAFNSEYIRDKLQNLKITIDGQPMRVNTRQVQFCLPDDEHIALTAEIFSEQLGGTKEVAFTAVPRLRNNGYCVSLEDVEYPEGEEQTPELTTALLESASELLDLRNFELEGMSLRVKGLEVQNGKLILQAEAHIKEFPDA